MNEKHWEGAALGVGLAAALVAVVSGRLPRRLRILLVLGVAAIALGLGALAFKRLTKPTTLTVAVSTIDGEGTRLASVIASQMAAAGARVRLRIVDKPTIADATKAFSSGETDLVLARADADGLTGAQSIAVMSYGVLLLMTPAGSPLSAVDQLKGKTIGVIGEPANRKIVNGLIHKYDLERAGVRFKGLGVDEASQALKAKQIDALLVVTPLSDKYLTLLRGLFPKVAKKAPSVLPIEAAGAMAAVDSFYESFDLPKGTFQGAPPVPDDDTTTLRVPYYLLAKSKLSERAGATLARALMDARRDLIGAHPMLSQISAPNTDRATTDKDAFIPVHPGAAAYYGGEEKTFFDMYGDALFYGSMLLGSLASVVVAAWKYMTRGEQAVPLPRRIYALIDEVSVAASPAELAQIEQRMDALLRAGLEPDDANMQAGALGELEFAARRVERAIDRRRQALGGAAA